MVEEAEWREDDAEDKEADKANKDNGDEEGEDKDDSVAWNFELISRKVNSFIKSQL